MTWKEKPHAMPFPGHFLYLTTPILNREVEVVRQVSERLDDASAGSRLCIGMISL